jgi:hypothetical protein
MALFGPVWSHRGRDFIKQEKNVDWASTGYDIQFSSKFGAKLSFLCPSFLERFQPITAAMCAVAIYVLVHLILSLSILYPDLIKFHDFADNSQEGMKHQMRGATQAQPGKTLRILYYFEIFESDA